MMIKKKSILAVIFIALVLLIYGCAPDPDSLFQSSTITALMNGIYDGDMTIGELRKYGDFGIGTFNQLDGEMVSLEGKFYQVKADGRILTAPRLIKTPFSEVTFFTSDKSFSLDKPCDYDNLTNFIDRAIPDKNVPYAIKISGRFDYVKVRSVPSQRKPYPLLIEAVKNQSVFEGSNIMGTLVGFRMPEFMQGVSVPGYHLHFLSQDRKFGGHLLGCNISSAKIEIDDIEQIRIRLLKNIASSKAELSAVNDNKSIAIIEKDR